MPILLPALLLVGCGDALTGYGARYAGALPGCGLATATLSRRGAQFTFVPGDGALTIAGPVAPDGSFSGSLNTQPAGKPPFTFAVRGVIADTEASVDLATPRCHAAARLARVRSPTF